MWEVILWIATIRIESLWQILLWTAVTLSLLATYLNIKKRKSCFVIWAITALVLMLANLFHTHDYAQTTLFVGYVLFDIYGWFRWRRDERTKT